MRMAFDSPQKDNFLCDFLNKMWEDGWLDDFSDRHFLIKAMYGKVKEFAGYKQLKENNFNIYNHSNNFSLNFSINLSNKLSYLCKVFGEDKIRTFVENQLSAGKVHYDENQFFRALSEIEVLKYFGTFGSSILSQGIYEPAIGKNGKNPEARFYYKDGTILDIEVKTPGFSHEQYKEKVVIPAILLNLKGREKIISYAKHNNITCIMPRMHKLVEFINNAAEKFEIPTSEKHYNLLYINWSYSEFPSNSYLEAYSILYNELNGLLKHKDIGIKMGILEDAYYKISAIVVYTSSLNTIVFQDLRYLWSTRCFAIMPLNCDEKLLLRITDMDYKNNRITPYLLCDFKANTIDEQVKAAFDCVEFNRIIMEHKLQ